MLSKRCDDDITQLIIMCQFERCAAANILSKFHMLCKGFHRAIFVNIVFLWGKHCQIAGGCVTILTVLPTCRIILLEKNFHTIEEFFHMILTKGQIAAVISEENVADKVFDLFWCLLG